MFYIFTRSLMGALFQALLVFSLSGYEAEACISVGADKPITLSGSTFIREKIIAREANNDEIGGTFAIVFGKTAVYHNGRCWYFPSEGACLSAMRILGEATGKTVKFPIKGGLVEEDDFKKILMVYSITQGKKDTSKPYLKVREHKDICNNKGALVQKCVSKYDEEGCNTCRLVGNNKWGCGKKRCNPPRWALANKCLQYASVPRTCPTGVNFTVTAYNYKNGPAIGRLSIHHDPNATAVAKDLSFGSSGNSSKRKGNYQGSALELRGNEFSSSSAVCGINRKPFRN